MVFFFQAEDGIRDRDVTGVQTCALPISGPADAPEAVRPSPGKVIGELIATMKATRERSRQSIERLATLDPRQLRFKHAHRGDLDLAQWWELQRRHDAIHLAQIRDVKRAPGFPKA